MHIIALLVSIIVGASVWWWRIRMVKRAGATVIDAAERFRARRNRARVAGDEELSPVTAISDPVTAAATFIRLTVGAEVWKSCRSEVEEKLGALATPELAGEATTYAEWAGKEALPREKAFRALTRFLKEALTPVEREQLARIVETAAAHGDAATKAEANRRVDHLFA